MELSVIIPCYNGAGTIGEQLNALANQLWSEEWEVIIADNGSTDNLQEVVAQFLDKVPNLRVIDASGRPGRSYALNRGVEAAGGRLLAFCDADDIVAPDWVKAVAQALVHHRLIAGALEHSRLNEVWTLEARGCQMVDELMECWYAPFLPFGFGANMGVWRELHEALGGFDESFDHGAEDMDYCWRAQLTGVTLHFAPNAVVHYRYRHKLRSIYRQAFNYAETNVQVYKKFVPLGMPRVEAGVQAGIQTWVHALVRIPLMLRSKTDVARTFWRIGWQIGLLKGSLKYKTLLLGTPVYKPEIGSGMYLSGKKSSVKS